MKVNIRCLEAFRETMRSGSATAAARKLGISQPAISRLLTQCEEQVGFDVFHRENGRLIPTPEASILLEAVDSALNGLGRVAQMAENISAFRVGELRIVAPPSLVEGPLARSIASFMALYPDVRVTIDPRDLDTARELVVGRSYDLGFYPPGVHPGLRYEKFITTETVCVLPQDHPLATLETIRPADLKGQALVLTGKGRYSRVLVEEAFQRANVYPEVRLETHTIGSACIFASLGVGIAIVNELMAGSYLGHGVAIRRFRPRIPHDYAFMTAENVPLPRAAQAFIAHCRTSFR
jgi:DNA-binding transcriptional LysR family regulator